MTTKEWFGEWFDSPYYHQLYKHRDYREAENFITNLVDFLNPKSDDMIIDLACGKGRHSIFLNKLGYNVLGLDLSKKSIEYASDFSSDTLAFDVHDMREPLPVTNVDIVVNLFTSFGYFDDKRVNEEVLQQVYNGLKPEGLFIIDFMNVHHVLANLVPEEEKELDGLIFQIKRFVEDDFIVKQINFMDAGVPYSFHEKVRVLKEDDFDTFFERTDFTLLHKFGDYQLRPFNKEASPRFIAVVKK